MAKEAGEYSPVSKAIKNPVAFIFWAFKDPKNINPSAIQLFCKAWDGYVAGSDERRVELITMVEDHKLEFTDEASLYMEELITAGAV